MSSDRTHYETLGLDRAAPPDDIKKAYRNLMRTYHPDIYTGDREEGERIASEIGYAYSILSDEQTRAEYDRMLDHGPDEGPDPAGDAEDVHPEDFEDSWGEEETWEVPPEDDDAVLDDGEIDADVVDDAPPPSTPEATAGAATGWLPNPVPEAHVITPLTGIGPVAAMAALVTLLSVIWAAMAPQSPLPITNVPAVLGAFVLGAVLGVVTVAVRKKGTPAPEPVKRPCLTVALVLGAVLVVAYILAGLTLLGAAVTALLGALVSVHVLARAAAKKRTLDALVDSKTLKANNLYGRLPGGAAADLLDSSLMALCALPSVRILRNPDDTSLFSHAVVSGNRIALVKAILATNGIYRWSGPSLMRDNLRQGNIFPEEIVRANYQDMLANPPATIPSSAGVDAWLVIYTEEGNRIVSIARPENTYPQVAAPDAAIDQIGHFLADSDRNDIVDQETVIGAFGYHVA